MISNIKIGRGFGGALRYALDEEKGYLLDTNMAGETVQALAAEFSALRALRPNLHRVVFHASLSIAPDENLTDAQWQEIGQRYLQGMGYADSQYVLVRHTDTEHQHLHLIANRITHQGEVVSDSLDYARAAQLVQGFEQDYGLQHSAHTPQQARQMDQRAPTHDEIEMTLRTGEPSMRQQLQALCRSAASDCHSFTDYHTRLDAVGVELIPVVQLDGAKLAGLSYRLDGVVMKGSDLGKAYSPAGLAKQGISYDQDRDFTTARHCLEREALRTFSIPDQKPTENQSPERRGTERDLGTLGPGNGRFDRGDPRDPEHGQERSPEPSAAAAKHPQRLDDDMATHPGAHRSSYASTPESCEPDQGDVRDTRPDRGRVFSTPYERILALASPVSHSDTSQRSRHAHDFDRTAHAVQKQIQALGPGPFEVGIRDSATGRMMNRHWSSDELTHSLPWLKRMNAQGDDIYLRPAGEHPYVLVDDLNSTWLQQMTQAGFEPAAVIETSPGNFQAWVRLDDTPVAPEVRHFVARHLAQQFHGDVNSADSRHYGRLAGFTNQKPQHRTEAGHSPYVLAHACSGHVARAVQQLKAPFEQQRAAQDQKTRLEAIQKAIEPRRDHDPAQEYLRQAKRLLARYGPSADYSRIDWMIAKDMAKSGHFTQNDIAHVLRAHSPHVEERKTGHVQDYAERTAQRAFNAPDVVQHRRHQHDQDFEL